MSRFIDEVRIEASSGAGGPGLVAFRREKFITNGGPWGGDGGRGGDVVFVATRSKNTLSHVRYKQHVKAKNGTPGGSALRTGRGGEDAVVVVPVGTLIKDLRTGEVLADLSEHDMRVVVLKGGKGGMGNARFKTSTRRAPDFAQQGLPGESRELTLELKLLADVGLLGFPNAGKSTLISRLSEAKPKIAAYPFTTLRPSLGVVRVPGTYDSFVMADIPGLVEGAAEGVGLGHQFLRHVERCALLLHLLSLDPLEDDMHGDPMKRFATINAELERFDPALARRPQVIFLSKADLVSESKIDEVREAFEGAGHSVFVGSSVTGAGLDPLTYELASHVKKARDAESDGSESDDS
ncbi:MAG: GTPase ObgE [Deltaproteobacteria bacterium]|nr:GTPase ObgE [Deltaproteobacteria bacterium]